MSDTTERLVKALRVLLREHLKSPAVRAVVREVAILVIEEADRIEHAGSAVAEPGAADSDNALTGLSDVNVPNTVEPDVVLDSTLDRRTTETQIGVVPLTLGDGFARVSVPGSDADLAAAHRSAVVPAPPSEVESPEREDVDLALVVERSRLKAASCRLFMRRRATADDPLTERQMLAEMNGMIERARSLRGCFLWVFWRDETQPEDDRLELIARNYEALAEGAELCHTILQSSPGVEQTHIETGFQMLAEANSALRQALRWTWLTNPDTDQDEAHDWLRRQTWERQIFVPRYMKVSDPGDPQRAPDLLGEIRSLAALLSERKAAVSRHESLFKRLRYHARRAPPEGTADPHDCQRINDCVEDLLDSGVRPDDARLRVALGDLRADAFPAETPPGKFVLDVLSTFEGAERVSAAVLSESRWSERVLEARDLLKGSSVVVVGGERRPDAVDRLKEAFELDHVEWMALSEHGSAASLRAPISRRHTSLVIVLTKLTGHLHAEEARTYAREAGVPMVTMPAGYNPEQVAVQVLSQAADRLRATANGV